MAMDSSARESGMSVQEYALLGDRARADTLLSDRVSSGDQGGMHWVRAAAIQATWSTSSSTVLLPWIFGTLGYVGGPLCLVVFVGLALVVQLKVVELAAEHGAMSDMADVGEALAGEPGRRLFRGLLLANHTCIAQLFAKTVTAYDRIRKRNAFMENYRREPMFADNLDEFDDARDVVTDLRDEYAAAETDDYVDWGSGPGDDDTAVLVPEPGAADLPPPPPVGA